MTIKIVRIIARLNIGGPARSAVLLSQGAERRAHGDGWETVLVCGEVSEAEGDMMYLAREKGLEPIVVKELKRELSFVNDWRAFWKIYKIICRERPHIIHTHTAKAGTIGRLAGILYKLTLAPCKLVHTFHGHVLHGYFGGIKTWFFIWVEKVLAIFTDRIITVSETLKNELVKRFRIAPEKKLSVIELGFELDELSALPPREKSDCVDIGIIGRLVPVKNHKMLFEVARRIAHSAERNVRFLVVGDGELRQELEDYVKRLGLKDIVKFKGWTRDLPEIYKDLDIVVLTSLNEGTPVSIIEAMTAARPVVATKVGGVLDVVQDGMSGYLAETEDHEGFAEKLLDLIRDGEKRKRFGEYGRGLVKERFSKGRLIRDMERLYGELIESR